MAYTAADDRYDSMTYRRTGLDLPAVSLGLGHNFGDDISFDRQRAILRRAVDLGVTHFDLRIIMVRRTRLRHASHTS